MKTIVATSAWRNVSANGIPSIATATPGLDLCEHLPQLARETDKLCLVRSMTHRMPVHGPACSEMYSGRPYFGPPVTDQATPQDWPSIAALVQRYGAPRPGLPHSVVLPWYSQFVGQDKRIAGQTGGRMGERHNYYTRGKRQTCLARYSDCYLSIEKL